MDDYTIRPITKADVEHFGVSRQTIKGWAVDYQGKLACVAGVGIHPIVNEAFCAVDVQAPKKKVMRCARELFERIKTLGPCMAIADENTPNAGRFLERLGFINKGDYYLWHS